MKIHRTLIVAICLCFFLSGCSTLLTSALVVTPVPTVTVLPTYTPYPTFTPLPTAVPTKTARPTHAYRPITWDELNEFLANDHTNWHAYDIDKYNCVNYAMDLVANAQAENYNAWIVAVSFRGADVGHAFVAFETSDKGTIWIEPQSDYAYAAVKVGQPLCLKIDPTRCQDWGIVEEVEQPVQCNALTHHCWPY